MIDKPPVFNYFFAKTNPDKLLTAHLYETGKTAEFLLKNSMLSPICDEITRLSGLSKDETISLCAFLAAMHDIGKIAPAFQLMLKGRDFVSQYLPNYDIDINDIESKYRHEIYSGIILEDFIFDKFEELRSSEKRRLSGVLKSHHQGNTKGFRAENDYPIGVKGNQKWKDDVVIPFIDFVRENFPVEDSCLKTISKRDIWNNSLYELLTGIVVISDWGASGQTFKDTREQCSGAEIRDRLGAFIADSDIAKIDFKPKDFKTLFNINSLRPIQETISNIIEKDPLFDMMLIEAPMGEGKTKCGLYSAIKALIAANKSSLYVALPTGATATAMLKDVNELSENLGIKEKAKLLTHTSWLTEQEDKEALKYLDLIFRKFKLFSPVAVGTVDQIMTAAQNVYYNEVKLTLLAGKVVLIDEIHAYDVFMDTNITRLLEYLHKYHVPVIMMSATLSDDLRGKLLSIYTKDKVKETSYPMITICKDNKVDAYKCETSQKGKKINIKVEEISDILSITDDVIEDANKGACVGIVVNTVKSAQNLYSVIKTEASKSGIEVYLLHSRFPIFVKDALVKRLVGMFGPDRKERPKKAIVIATQVIEMSVDVDFDCIYTQLAPSDAILQRAGRVRRHSDKGTIREKGFTPFVKVIVLNPSDKWEKRKVSIPYNEELLEKSKEILEKYKEIVIPDDIPDIINESYKGIKTLEHKNKISEKKANTTIIEDPEENCIETSDLPNKIQYHPTREEDYETISVFMGTDEELEAIRGNYLSKEEYVKIYGTVIVTTPKPNESDMKTMEVIERGCKYFDGVCDGRSVYILDKELGLIKKGDVL